MQIIQVQGKACRVRRPVYITGKVSIIRDENRKSTMIVRCQLVFPSTDQAVVDRAPIVNSGVCVLGAWNLTNIGAEWLGRGRLIAQDFRVESLQIIRPDEKVDAELTANKLRQTRRGRLTGAAVIVLKRRGKVATRISVRRFTEFEPTKTRPGASREVR